MIITKSKSTLITIIVHILIWGVFGLIYFFQPLNWNIIVPYQLWIKQFFILGLLIVAYYLNAFVLVPKLLLKNKTGMYLLLIFAFAAVIVTLNTYIDEWLDIHRLLDIAVHKSVPQKHHDRG